MKRFPHYRQLDMMSCGPTCLRIVAEHFGQKLGQQVVERATYKGRAGVTLLNLCDAAERLGLRTLPVMTTYDHLLDRGDQPFIAHWRQEHFLVVYRVTKTHVHVSDPASDRLQRLTREEFCTYWHSATNDGVGHGIGVYFETTPEFFRNVHEDRDGSGKWGQVLGYLRPHRALIWQLVLALLSGTILALFLPFLTQTLVDFGVTRQDLDYVYVVVAGLGVVYLGQVLTDLLRGWLMLYISARLNISLIADFLARLLRATMGYIHSKNIGDILERLNDHEKIQIFLTAHAFTVLFGLVNIVVYSLVLGIYDLRVLTVFVAGTISYFTWAVLFLRARRRIDYRRFNEMSSARSTEVELIKGLPDIKLAGAETQRRWGWERIQARLFRINLAGLRLEQVQLSGATLINHATTLFITLLVARAVIEGRMTLGEMLAVNVILGQLNGPLTQFLAVLQVAQDASLALERAADVKTAPMESSSAEEMLPEVLGDIELKGVCFRYGDPTGDWVLDNISLTIPEGKTTAIVGESGSGKTTLFNLLLQFYPPERGTIKVGGVPFNEMGPQSWRRVIGAVLQDGTLFTDTIARNIALGEDSIDHRLLNYAAETAAINEFIATLPLGFNTIVGPDAAALSGGQKQRLLIARAVFKSPKLFLFDEATSALDAVAERQIVKNIEERLEGVTKLVIAHRLSTVQNAEQIIVMDRGRITEQGTHEELIGLKGTYFRLVRNQLELAN